MRRAGMRRDEEGWAGMGRDEMGWYDMASPPPYNAIGEESSSHQSPFSLKPLCLSEVCFLLRCVVSYVLEALQSLKLACGTRRLDPSG